MKLSFSLWLIILFSWSAVTSVFAEALPKDVIEVKDAFDKKGATSCSQAMADTINFLANGRPFNYNLLWGNTDINSKPISVDFLISGFKGEVSSNGSIVLIPIKDKCVGDYVYTYVEPSHNCKIYMQKNGFDDTGKYQATTYSNGEGGTGYFLSIKNINNINFIFNDVVGGCSMTIREMLSIDAKK